MTSISSSPIITPPVISETPQKFRTLFQRLEKLRQNSDAIVDLLLGEEYAIPKDLQLQIMAPTLRSSLHKTAFFTKLYCTGKSLLDVQCQIFHISRGSASRNLIEGLDFMSSSPINSLQTLKVFVENFGLDNALIPAHKCAPPLPRDLQLIATVDSLLLLVGAVYFHHGPTKTANFIQSCIINGRSGLYRIHTRLHESSEL